MTGNILQRQEVSHGGSSAAEVKAKEGFTFMSVCDKMT